MAHENSESVREALTLATKIRGENQWFTPLVAYYWSFSFWVTKVYEKYILQSLHHTESKILNFGCGNRFYEKAINSDLLALHRYLKGKRRPDLYWSGTAELKALQQYMEGIVCEHVIEHMLPDNAQRLIENFLRALQPGGLLIVSFPDVKRIIGGYACQGFNSPIVSANSVIYRYGHRFMYDTELVATMLQNAGFDDIRIVDFNELPLQEFLDPGREVESSYVTARKP